MFEDKRSKKVLMVAHCIFNQNAKLDRCAHYPGAIMEVAEILVRSGVGMLQLPCPELLYLGLDRQAEQGNCSSVESEDTRIALRMAQDQGKALCQELANNLIYQIEEYQRHGFTVLGVLGINGSPTCGVETTWAAHQEKIGRGLFMQALHETLHQKDMALPMKGIKAYEPQQAIATVTELLRL